MTVIEIDQSAVDLVAEFEGFVNHWYPDPALGWIVPTCCYGHTDAAGEPRYSVTKGKTFTPGEGRGILALDLAAVADAVFNAVKVPLNAHQFGALVSFTFNLGIGNLKKSTLLKKVNAGDYVGAQLEFAKWNRAGGKILKGLTRRRAAEAALFARRDPLAPADTLAPPTAPLPAGEAPGGLGALISAIIKAIAGIFGRNRP